MQAVGTLAGTWGGSSGASEGDRRSVRQRQKVSEVTVL